MSIIQVDHLTKHYRVYKKGVGVWRSIAGLVRRRYELVRAVEDVSFSIEPGEMVGFLGPNGAGKTTTLKMLSGLLFPTSGEAKVLGHTPWRRDNAFRRQFALVMGQKNQLWWDLPANESFLLNRDIYGVPDEQFRRVLGELSELLDVKRLLDVTVRELSLGERMKMELIGCLLHSPKVLFLDEPTIGLDVVAQSNIRDCLSEYNDRMGTTILLTSHYMRDIESLCERVIIISGGRIKHDGPLSAVLERFNAHKLLQVKFHDGQTPTDLNNWGKVTEWRPPVATMEVDRREVPKVTASLLDRFQVDDISIEEPPIEEVIAEVFRTSNEEDPGGEPGTDPA
jgi:ABC-2 type transport system ATP-binding protein